MGNNSISHRINGSNKISSRKEMGSENYEELSRMNFRFHEKVSTTGYNNESIIWLGENKRDGQKYYIKQSNKKLLFENNRVNCIHNQLTLLIKEHNKFVVQPLYAFQDYQYLYLVFQYVDGFTLQQVLRQHTFTQQQAKYIIITLINIIQHFHQQKYAITELSPKNLLIQSKTGHLKLLELVNPILIDSYYPSNVITNLNTYSAPEIIAMDEVRTESDYYSLGLILYQIMKQKHAIPEDIIHDRISIIHEEIQVVKSDLPEGWKPQAADFLVKLLIKNPELRLGKYGSFEVRTHPWLQNCSWSQNYSMSTINLGEQYFGEKKIRAEAISKPLNDSEQVNEYGFQCLFENYSYKISENKKESFEYDSLQQQF